MVSTIEYNEKIILREETAPWYLGLFNGYTNEK